MLKPNLHWVSAIAPYRLALMARPTGGEWLEQAVLDLRADKVDTVVSLLETPEVRELALQQEAALCQAHGIEFMAFPIPDRGTPHSKKAFSTLLEQLHAQLLQGRGVAIHCRAGIGRTGVLAACLLHMLDVPQRDLFLVLSKARGVTMPDTDAQAEWWLHLSGPSARRVCRASDLIFHTPMVSAYTCPIILKTNLSEIINHGA